MGRFVVPNEGEVYFLRQVFFGSYELHFRLFQNAVVVGDATVIGDLVEADYTGYAEQPAAAIAPTSANGYAGLTNPKGFTGTYSALFPGNSGADQTVYGVYITYLNVDSAEVLLGAANVFDANPAISLAGKTISGAGDLTAVLFNLRLWDFFTGVPALPVGEHFTLWTDTYGTFPSLGIPFTISVADRFTDELVNVTSARTCTFTSTDPLATLPVDFDFTGQSGVGTMSLTLNTAGSQQVTATDTSDGSVIGKISLFVAT